MLSGGAFDVTVDRLSMPTALVAEKSVHLMLKRLMRSRAALASNSLNIFPMQLVSAKWSPSCK